MSWISYAHSKAKAAIAFPDLPQCPVNGLFDEIPLVTRIAFDQRGKLYEALVLCSFVMDCQFGHQHKTCPPHKLPLPLTPLFRLLIGVGRFLKEIPTDLVAHVPNLAMPSTACAFARCFTFAITWPDIIRAHLLSSLKRHICLYCIPCPTALRSVVPLRRPARTHSPSSNVALSREVLRQLESEAIP